MRLPQQRFLLDPVKLKPVKGDSGMVASSRPLQETPKWARWNWLSLARQRIESFAIHYLSRIKAIGTLGLKSEYEVRKLRIFNLLNFLCLVAALLVPVVGLLSDHQLPSYAWLAAFAPALVSIVVLVLNYYHKYEAGMITYFVLYPVITSFVYLNGINLGVDLFFILYGILSVFFIPRITDMLFSIGLSMISYFMLSVVLKHYNYKLETINFSLYLFNQGLAICFIFYGLFLIKKENAGFESLLLNKNRELQEINALIEKQKAETAQKASLLEVQTQQLKELNTLKNKLFSVISHDMKAPMYALRNLFQNVQQLDLPGDEIKGMLPEVVNDLNYTTDLMENLLQWAKTQMQASTVHAREFDIAEAIRDVLRPLGLSAKAKRIRIEHNLKKPVYVYADPDMINLVLRNLLSNAIKFTPVEGNIFISTRSLDAGVEVAIRDTGVGIGTDEVSHLFNDFYTSTGTANESGTGLGLILCKEFLAKNGGNIRLASEKGKGSTFFFTLPVLA